MKISFITLLLVFSPFSNTWAYVGPGLGITLLGTFWTVILILLTAFGGLLVWPVRALWRRGKGPPNKKQADDDDDEV